MDEKKFEEKNYVLELLCENKKLTMSLYHDHKTYRELPARTSLAADLPKKKSTQQESGESSWCMGQP
jgi:hypothetical protein